MAETKEYDVVILGGGSGGYATALRAGQLGMSVALVEADKVGGTCLHRGCVPTKAILHAGEVADESREGPSLGIKSSFEGVDMPALNAFKDGIISGNYKGLQGLIKSRGVDIIDGWGTLTAKDTVTVDGVNYKGKHVVLASGSYSKTIGQTITERVITSTEALNLNYTPKKAIILGGGVIGVEFASAWTSFGTEVQIIEGLPHLVPNEDEVISRNLERQFKKRGIKFKTKTMFDRVEESADGVKVFTQDGDVYEADILLIAIGRGPATSGLGFEEQGVEMDRGYVLTDERLRTNVDGIYAVGDIVPGLQLAHRGFLQGIFVAEDIAGLNPRPINERHIPRVTFSNPEIASVGLTEKQAKEEFGAENVETAEFSLAGNAKSKILDAAGTVKYIRQKNGPVVGFAAIGKRMSEQIGEGELIVGWEAYPEDFNGLIHAHPTQNETLGEAMMALAGKPLHVN